MRLFPVALGGLGVIVLTGGIFIDSGVSTSMTLPACLKVLMGGISVVVSFGVLCILCGVVPYVGVG